MRENGRVIGIVLLAALVAAAGTSFGAVAVPEAHPAAEASEHEHAAVEHQDALRPGELAGALLVSLNGIGIVPLARQSGRRRGGRTDLPSGQRHSAGSSFPGRRNASSVAW
jgi:hypothetical protein